MRSATRRGSGRPRAVAAWAGSSEQLEPLVSILKDGGFEVVKPKTIDVLPQGSPLRRAEALVLGLSRTELRRPSRLQRLRRELPELPLVVVSSGRTRQAVRDAITAGADGYLPEPATTETLTLVVEAVLEGNLCVPRWMRRHVARPVLSYRERQALALVCRGLTNEQIARQMSLSLSTVKSHLVSSFRKLGVSSRAEAAALLLERTSSGRRFAQLPGGQVETL